jgi:pimeloyl-ACP methyl ester carboxylesterase
MRLSVVVITAVAFALAGTQIGEDALSRYAGVYQWGPNAFIYLQMWNEFVGTNQLVAFDESGDVRVLFPAEADHFLAGAGAAVPTPVESRIDFQRDSSGPIASLIWRRYGAPARTAKRVEIEKREDVVFPNAEVHLAGTLISPRAGAKHPAIILVHGSGPESREYMLPYAHFLVRLGYSVLGYDKRGVGGSTGDWTKSSFDDLAGDVVAAFRYLKTRRDIDASYIGLMGISQAGWVMPLAANRERGIAFVISICGAGISPAETTVDQARNEMTARGMATQAVTQIVELMKLQNAFVRTGKGWDEYIAARKALAARMGTPPPNFPDSPDSPYWESVRPIYSYEPKSALRDLRTPVLAFFGGLDNNILAVKNQAAWESALKEGGNPDYTLRIIPGADHLLLEAKTGSNVEMRSLRRFAPEYFTTVRDWLAKRVR